jgi:iron complex transport system ATP-binding protein
MIHASRLSVAYPGGLTVLEPIDMMVESETVLGVYGPNGSGKSTLLRALSGRNEGGWIQGEVRVAGVPIQRGGPARERASKIVYLGSDFRAPFDLSVRDLFEMGVESCSNRLWPGITRQEREKIAGVVEALQIHDFLGRSFQTLSDGEKQLMMFARGLMQAPKVLVLDETFSKLDLDRLMLVAGILRAWAMSGMAFVIASHDLNFLSEVSDQLLFLKKGRAVAQGPADQVLQDANLRVLFERAVPQVVVAGSGKKKIVY